MDAYNPRMSINSRQLRRPYLCALIPAAIAVAVAGCDDQGLKTEPGTEGCDGSTCMSPTKVDAGKDAGNDAMMPPAHDAGDSGATDGAIDAGDSTLPSRCTNDRDCDDGVYCNGEEVCIPLKLHGQIKRCWRPEQGPCADRACDEVDGCDCSDPDRDHDTVLIPGCAKPGDPMDCDDYDKHRNSGLLEICDPKDKDSMKRDEDCDWNTVGERDKDGDQNIDHNCANFDPQYLKYITGLDCDDDDPETNIGAAEVCDNKDNDCDGKIDETYGAPSHKLHKFYVDADGDTRGSDEFIETLCNSPPPGYAYETGDCDDTNPLINPMREEVCNGKDDDCLAGIDKPLKDGDLLFDEPFDGMTKFECEGADGWKVQTCPPLREDCNHDYHDACEIPITTMDNCHACGRKCTFSCGEQGCDEVEELSAGLEHMCARTTEGRALCWGRNEDGRLGNGSTDNSSVPTYVSGLKGVAAIASGDKHTCAIAGADKSVYCWGNNSDLQLGGTDSRSMSDVPVQVLDPDDGFLTDVEWVATGAAHSCAVYGGGKVACWGQQGLGRLADGSLEEDTMYPAIISRAGSSVDDAVMITDGKEIVAGSVSTCLLTTAGKVECWGDNSMGQIGADSTVASAAFGRVVDGLPVVTKISGGSNHTCALADGHVYCWGDNSFGQLGRQTDQSFAGPGEVPGLVDVKALDAGFLSTCVVTEDGSVLCWGNNEFGERGDATYNNSSTERSMVAISDVDSVAMGTGVCARTDAREVLCWGSNLYGQLGNGRTSEGAQSIPTAALSPNALAR